MQAVIIAGGKGTRLQSVTADLPKVMVEVGGRPLLEHQILLARKHGFTDILCLTGHGAEHIESYFGNSIRYRRETSPLGTAGAVLGAMDELDDRFLVLYGDTALNVDLQRMWNTHPQGAAATLFLHPNDHPHDSDLVEVDAAGRITHFHPYPHPQGAYLPNLVNAALYVVNKEALQPWRDHTGSVDFGKHLFPALLAHNQHLHGYVSREYIKDAGTPHRLDRVRQDFASGRIAHGSLATPAPAVFLDRDGTLNTEIGFLRSPERLELLPGAAEAVRAINHSGHLAVIITNQPVIARGECSEADLQSIHNRLAWLLGEQGAYLDAIYYCPHHPHAGFAGERADLKIGCECRKPGTALFAQAARELNIDIARSWMVGDRPGDIEAGKNFGVKSVLVLTGPESERARSEAHPDHIFADVLSATRFMLAERTAG